MLRLLGHAECEDDADWVKQCMVMEVVEYINGGEVLVGLCREGIKSFGLS